MPPGRYHEKMGPNLAVVIESCMAPYGAHGVQCPFGMLADGRRHTAE